METPQQTDTGHATADRPARSWIGWVLVGMAVGMALGALDASMAVEGTAWSWADAAPALMGVDGAVGAVVGAICAAFLPAMPRVGAAIAGLAILAGATAAGVAGIEPAEQPAEASVDAVASTRLLWVIVDGFGSADLDADLPQIEALQVAGLTVPRIAAGATTRDAALAVQLTGLPLSVTDTDTELVQAVDGFSEAGFATHLVLQGDPTRDARWGTRSTVHHVAGGSLLGLPAAASRGAWTHLSFGPVAPRDLVERVDAVLAGEDAPWALVVELVASDAEDVDDQLGRVLEVARKSAGDAELVVAVSGLRGRPDPEQPEGGTAQAVVPLLLDHRGDTFAGRQVPSQLGAEQVGPTVLSMLVAPLPEAFGGPALDPYGIEAELAFVDSEAEVAVGGRTRSPCMVRLGTTRDRLGVTRLADGRRMLRSEGYVVVQEPRGDTWASTALYDEVSDPYFARDLLPSNAGTCTGRPADALVDLLATAAERRATSGDERATPWADSRDLLRVDLPDDFPEPTEPLPRLD